MATIDLLVLQVGLILKLEAKIDIPKPELREMIISRIQTVQDVVPNDVLKDLLFYHDYAMDGSDNYIDVPTDDFLRLVSIVCIESDGEYGHPFKEKSLQQFQSIKKRNYPIPFDSTDIRIYTLQEHVEASFLNSNQQLGWLLYPIPPASRVVHLSYIRRSTETGDLTLPTLLHQLVVNGAAGMFIDRRYQLYERELSRIQHDWWNRFGLQPATVGSISTG